MKPVYTSLRPAFLEALKQALSQYETPFYAYDLAAVASRVERLKSAFPQARLMYALKANPRLGLLRRLRGWGVGVEAVSLGEVLRAYQAGYTPQEVLLNGPVKTPAMYDELHQRGMPLLGLDSWPDLERAGQLAPGAQVLLRLNPDLPIQTHDHLATGRGSSKFGILTTQAAEAIGRAQQLGLEVLGIHIHLGSALNHPEDFAAGYQVLEELLTQIGPQKVLNLGGGFGLDLDPAGLAPAAQRLADLFGAQLWLEPGRFLVAEAGVLVTRTWGTKQTRRRFILVDAGMMTLLRPMLYGAHHPVIPLYEGGEVQTWDLAGPVCESGDILATQVELPTPAEGDALVVLQAGAYGSSMSSNYLDHPRPLELLYTDQGWQVLRRAQTYESLLAEEV